MRIGESFVRVVTLVLLVLGAIVMPVTSPAAPKKYLSLATGNPGGTFYFLGAGFANIINRYVPEVRVIAESTAASEENYHYLLRKKVDMGLVSIQIMEAALKKNLDISGVRLISLGHTSDRHWFVRRESTIKSIPDFRGHRVAVGSPGSGTLVTTRDELAEVFGITFNDFKPAYLSFTESIMAIKDGTIDVGVIAAGYPIASLLDLARQLPLRLIPYGEEELKMGLTKFPYRVKVVIPKGTYQGINVDTLVLGTPTAWFCRRELSDELVYQMMKALYEHSKDKDAIHPQAAQWNLETLFSRGGVHHAVQSLSSGVGQIFEGKGTLEG